MNDDNYRELSNENPSDVIEEKVEKTPAPQEVTFQTEDEYVAFMRATIKENTPPKAWLSLKMLVAILNDQHVSEYYKDLGYDTLESFLADPKYKKLWRADKQNNSPFLVRYSHGLEIVQYIEEVEQAIRSLYFQKEHNAVTSEELIKALEETELPISYSHMGYPSFEVFLTDKRFAKQWTAETQENYTLMLRPVFNARDTFLDKTFISLKKYFGRQSNKPTKEKLVQFFNRGVASKVYQKYGFASLEDLAMDSTFDSLRYDGLKDGGEKNGASTGKTSLPKSNERDERAEKFLIDQINAAYSQLAVDTEWVSLTAVASRISGVKKRVQQLGYPSLSKFIQANAEIVKWACRYTDATPPDFQIHWLDNPGPPPEEEYPEEYYTEEYLINEIRAQVEKVGETWVLLAMIGQYIPNVKVRVERLGYDSLGAFIKDRTREGNWIYKYIDDIPAKLSIKLKKNVVEAPQKEEEKVESPISAPIEGPSQQHEKQRLNPLTSYLLEPGLCLNVQFDGDALLEKVASLAEEENWALLDKPYAILQYYLTSTLVRCAVQGILREVETNRYQFNTGLYARDGKILVGEVSVQSLPAGGTRLFFADIACVDESDPSLLDWAQYYNFKNRIPLETYIANPQYPLREINWKILGVEEDLDAFSIKLQKSWQRLKRQIRLAYSSYDCENNEMHLLLPLISQREGTPEEVLEIVWRGSDYEPIALLSLGDAYKKARVVSKLRAPLCSLD